MKRMKWKGTEWIGTGMVKREGGGVENAMLRNHREHIIVRVV